MYFTLPLNLFPLKKFLKKKSDYELIPMGTRKVETEESTLRRYEDRDKPFTYWKSLLSKEVQEKVDFNIKYHGKQEVQGRKYPDQYLALWNAFEWSKTSEGSNYWLEVSRKFNVK